MTGTMRGQRDAHFSVEIVLCTAERVRARRLSTSAVHGNAGLTWQDGAVPRIHCAYYDYESFYTEIQDPSSAHARPLRAGRAPHMPGPAGPGEVRGTQPVCLGEARAANPQAR